MNAENSFWTSGQGSNRIMKKLHTEELSQIRQYKMDRTEGTHGNM
jgi:hypothetical protein